VSCAVFGFAAQAGPSLALARALGVPRLSVKARHFPDRESLIQVEPSPRTALLYCSLDHPNDKLVEILLAASALRDNGAAKVILIAPYLAYMRQDSAFRAGEAVSQRVIGKLLAEHFDGLLTIDPHLHRTRSLAAVMPGIEAVAISAAPLLVAEIDKRRDPLLVGPDGEARQWVERIADRVELEFVLGRKRRGGDRHVEIEIPDAERANGRSVVIVDDLISSGGTLLAVAHQLRSAGAQEIKALATHCLATEAELDQLREAGISSVRATDSVPGPVGSLPIADLLAQEIRRRRWYPS
jgi:ribose-phosphate pyrophosphokinase